MPSALRFALPVQGMAVSEDEVGVEWSHVYNLAADANGSTAWSRQKNYTGFSHDTEYLMQLRNRGSGGRHLWVLRSTDAATVLQLTDTALTVTPNTTIAGTLSTGALTAASLAVTGNATVGGTLAVTGATTLAGLTAGATTLASLAVTGAATVGTTLGVTGLTSANGGLTTTDLTATGNTALGNANTDTMTVIGVSTFKNAAGTATQLYVDAGNNRVIVGSATALASDTTPNLQVVGRLYVAPESANDSAIQVRRSSAATVGWTVGVESTNDLIFKDDADTSIVRIGDVASTYQLDVLSGDFHVADDAVIAGDISSSRSVVGGTTFSGGEELRVVGQTRLEGATEVTTGGLTVSGGGITLSGPTNIDGNGGTAGQLRIGAVIVGQAALDGAEELCVNGQSRLKGLVTVTTGGMSLGGGLNMSGGFAIDAGSVAWVDIANPQTAGSAGALLGYLYFKLGGSDVKVPYHNV